MSDERHRQLMEPFPPEAIGTLPRGGTRLSYVGHAAVTKRLLEVDPEWTWEPVAWTAEGAPAIVEHGSMLVMWGRLTLCGVTRPGVGVAEAKKPEVHKELISDFLRNAAMRFGVALDLWSKEEIGDTISAGASPDHQRGEGGAAIAQPTQRRNVAVRGPESQASPPQPSALHEALTAKIKGLDDDQKGKLREFCGENGVPLVVKNMSPEQVSVVLDFLRGWEVIAQQFPGVEYAPDDPERPM